MYTHNLDPVAIDLGFFALRWYSLAYILGILIGWWLGKKIISKKFDKPNIDFDIKEFDNLITYIIISMIIGGRLGYVLFYNLGYYIDHPLDIIKLWEGVLFIYMGLPGPLISLVPLPCIFPCVGPK